MRQSKIGRTAAAGWIVCGLCAVLASNCYYWIELTGRSALIPVMTALGLAANLLPLLFSRPAEGSRLRICCHGTICLRAFLFSAVLSVIWQIALAFFWLPDRWNDWLWSILVCILSEAILFWNGILSVYCTSRQLGLKLRVIGVLCGPIPVAHLFALTAIIRRTSAEVVFESEKRLTDRARAEARICDTRYPILLVHGVFFRDYKFPNYWGRIPKALEQNCARIYYGNHQSAASVADSGAELAKRIRQIVAETGCKKVNIIAHSKGGLDCRYAIACAGASPYVASLTTVNTPHRGCEFAEYLLGAVPEKVKRQVEAAYNGAMKKLGDESPDFMAAVRDLTAESCRRLNEKLEETERTLYRDARAETLTAAQSEKRTEKGLISELSTGAPSVCSGGILRQSIGSRLDHASGGTFPLNFTYWLAKYFDGPNDGLVSEKSFRWGETYTFLTPNGRQGISHGDMIDLNRSNLSGFDVREFYVKLVHALKEAGL